MLQTQYQNNLLEAGCDEAGRGCLAGPVVAAAVILPADFEHPLLNDSKQMRASDRDALEPIIKARAIAWAIGMCDNLEIDALNILRASIKAMHKAVDALSVRPQLLLIDGNRFYPYPQIPHHCFIKGDGRFTSIAAASVLAKTERDRIMCSLHEAFPVYSWDHNKGYPTVAHRKAIQKHGDTAYHRKTFRLLKEDEHYSLKL
ncbi:MAG: ribonuclease HII [Chitinophagales bacterium]